MDANHRIGADYEPNRRNWIRDLVTGFWYALLIIVSILFFSGAASRFIYVDF